MVTASRNQIRTISTKSTIPHPALMGFQARFQWESIGISLSRETFIAFDVVRSRGVDGPDADVVVSTAGCEVAHVWREEHTRQVGFVGLELGDGDEVGFLAAVWVHLLVDAPDVDVALVGTV